MKDLKRKSEGRNTIQKAVGDNWKELEKGWVPPRYASGSVNHRGRQAVGDRDHLFP